MTENMAARGEGLAGLRDALNRHYWRDGKGCLCGWWAGDYNTWLEHMIPILAALEAAAPAGTARTFTKINDYGVLIREVEQAQDILKKLWDQLFYCERERDELGRALATPSPQAPQQESSFSTTSAREQSSATASANLSAEVTCICYIERLGNFGNYKRWRDKDCPIHGEKSKEIK